MENLEVYAPYIVIVVAYLIQNNVFVKPEQLEKKHREILEDIEDKYATKTELKSNKDDTEELKDKIDRMEDKIDKIYNKMFEG